MIDMSIGALLMISNKSCSGVSIVNSELVNAHRESFANITNCHKVYTNTTTCSNIVGLRLKERAISFEIFHQDVNRNKVQFLF